MEIFHMSLCVIRFRHKIELLVYTLNDHVWHILDVKDLQISGNLGWNNPLTVDKITLASSEKSLFKIYNFKRTC